MYTRGFGACIGVPWLFSDPPSSHVCDAFGFGERPTIAILWDIRSEGIFIRGPFGFLIMLTRPNSGIAAVQVPHTYD